MKFLSENKLFAGLFALALLLGAGYYYVQSQLDTTTETITSTSVESEPTLRAIQPAINAVGDEATITTPVIEVTPTIVEGNEAAESDAGVIELNDQREVRIE